MKPWTPALLSAQVASGNDPFLTLREVAELTRTPLPTIKRWVYVDRVLPTEPVGPFNHQRVRGSIVIAYFPFDP